jgi:hypothetical protein
VKEKCADLKLKIQEALIGEVNATMELDHTKNELHEVKQHLIVVEDEAYSLRSKLADQVNLNLLQAQMDEKADRQMEYKNMCLKKTVSH